MEDFERTRRRVCPLCQDPLVPTIYVPDEPDFWLRLGNDAWGYGDGPPHPEEIATVLSYRCGCGKTFRRVVAMTPPFTSLTTVGPPCPAIAGA